LLRILLHKGTSNDKITALLVSNGFAELRQHKVTMRFIELFHQCLLGNSPGFTKKWFVPKVYKHVFKEAVRISETKKNDSEKMVEIYQKSIFSINKELNEILFDRLKKKADRFSNDNNLQDIDFNELMAHFELPSEFRAYIDNKNPRFHHDIPELLDGIPFPLLASALILAAHFTSARVLYNARPLLQTFAEKLGHLDHPKRVLWLTDTFDDKNGVSIVLKAFHEEIKKRYLPIDLLVCSNTVSPDDHLIVIKPIQEFNFSFYQHQVMRIPNYLEIHNLFQKGEYDRVICSTEGPMGLAALYLKQAYSVKAYFYMHTDWIMFTSKVLNFEKSNLNRLRRMMRWYYKGFDGLFVLNSDHQKWLTGREMGFDHSRVFLTAHWADGIFSPVQAAKSELFNLDNDEPVVLFAGRVSQEKGISELPEIYNKAKQVIPKLRLVIAGTGPGEDVLKRAIPDATFLGWVDHDQLPKIYSAADLLILPSKFDTFSCVVLEALSCGLPVLAYKTKGPKDIVQDEVNGYLVSTIDEMIHCIVDYFSDVPAHSKFREAALNRSKDYNKDVIMARFVNDVGINQRSS